MQGFDVNSGEKPRHLGLTPRPAPPDLRHHAAVRDG